MGPAQRGSGPIDGGDARIGFQAPRQSFDGAQKFRLQRIPRRRLQPQLDHFEAVRAFKLARIASDGNLRIDIGERVSLQGKRRKLAGHAKERGGPAQHHQERDGNEQPAVARGEGNPDLDKAGIPAACGSAGGPRWRAQQRLQCRE